MKKERIRSKQVLQALEDDQAAGFIFRKLQPICCPSCESTSFKKGGSKKGSDICPLCKEQEPKNKTADDVRIIELGKEIDALEEQLSRFQENLGTQQKKLGAIEETLSVREKELEGLRQKKPSSHADEENSTRRKSLKETIKELESLEQKQDTAESIPTDELAILKATISETKKLYQAKEKQLFKDASTLLQTIASDLGVKHLVNVTWTSTRLKIQVANTETSYTKLSPGEKLRFRIAAAIAIAKLAAQTGQGRHPGVLFFDSPKAEEITEEDFQKILSAITKIADRDDDLQIFIASRIASGLEELDVFKDSKIATGEEFLF
ncbi:MAG: hypothetical protein D3924_09495 [Candidatus Electrothrix sp. AR4]|nr:hypothetical protein [Candidatus Electrothrix sp. AR4]